MMDEESSGNKIENNPSSDNLSDGIVMADSSTNDIIGNTIIGNRVGIHVRGASSTGITAPGTRCPHNSVAAQGIELTGNSVRQQRRTVAAQSHRHGMAASALAGTAGAGKPDLEQPARSASASVQRTGGHSHDNAARAGREHRRAGRRPGCGSSAPTSRGCAPSPWSSLSWPTRDWRCPGGTSASTSSSSSPDSSSPGNW